MSPTTNDGLAGLEPPGGRVAPRRLTAARWLCAGLIAAVYLLSLAPHWLPGEDSAAYRLLGRSLAEGKGYTVFGRPHAHVAPGFPLLLAAADRAGLDGPVARNAIVLVLAAVMICLAYLAVRQQAPPELAVAVVVLFALADHVHDVAMQVLSDVPCAVLVAAGLWLCVRWARSGRGWPELGTAALLAAVWFRLAALPLAAGAAVGMMLQRRKPSPLRAWLNAAALLVGAAATLGVFYAYYQGHAAGAAPSYAHRIDAVLSRGWRGWIVTPAANFAATGVAIGRLLTSQRMPWWLALLICWGPILAGMVRHLRRNHVICVAASAVYLGAFILSKEPRARYMVPVGFLLILYWAEGLNGFFGLTAAGRRVAPRATTAALVLLTAINLAPDLRRIYWVHHGEFLRVYRHGAKQDLYVTGEWLRRNAGPDDQFFSTEDTYALALVSGVRALPVSRTLQWHPPSLGGLCDLFDRQGVTLAVFTPGEDSPQWQVLSQQGEQRGWFDLAFPGESFRVYRYRRRRAGGVPAGEPATRRGAADPPLTPDAAG